MKRVSMLIGAVAVVLWAASAFAQAKPDFSGSWTLDAEKTAAANPEMAAGGGGGRGGRGGGAGAMTIKHDGSSLTVETQGRQGPQSVTYKLDGSEVQVPGGRGGAATAKAVWEGTTIVISTTRDMQGQMMTNKQVYSMDGAWLVVARENPNGTFKAYYKKG